MMRWESNEPECFTQIKIFSNKDLEDLEESVNEFCRDKNVINVRFVAGGATRNDKVVVVYRDFN